MSDVFQTITGGFFDSVNKDRIYSADQMNMPYKKIVADGLFFEGGDGGTIFKVTAGGDMTVNIGAGNALIGGKWAENEDSVAIEISGNTGSAARIDSIILRLDNSLDTRAIGIVYRQGDASAPDLVASDTVKEFRLANISVAVNASSITDANIVDTRGTAECPWVTSVVTPSDAQMEEGIQAYFEDNPDALGPAVMSDVSAWLAAHPEVTTTVQDNSITRAKINESYRKVIEGGCVTFRNIADMRSNFTSDMGICYVINDDSTYCQGYKGNYYEYIDTEEPFEEALQNGGWARLIIPEFTPLPGKLGEEIMPTLMDVAYSYCGEGVQYVESNGPFMPDAEDHAGIQCSQFVNCLLNGLLYERSKLMSEDNNNIFIYGGTDVIKQNDEKVYLSAQQMAHYAACHGWLKESHKLSDCEVGDVVFFQNLNPNYDYYLVDWRAINHVAMVIGKIGQTVLLVQAGGLPTIPNMPPQIYRPGAETDAVNFAMLTNGANDFYVDSSGRGMFGFARFPMFYRPKSPTEAITHADISGSHTAAESNKSYYLTTETSPTHSFRYGVLAFRGYSGLKNSGTGLYVVTDTVNSEYGAGTVTNWNTGANMVGGGVMPVLCRADGASKVIKTAMVIRSASSTLEDSYELNDIELSAYA